MSYILYVMDSLFPPRIRIITLKELMSRYNEFNVLFIHPAFSLVFRILQRLQRFRIFRILDLLILLLSHKIFPGARTVILGKKAPSKC